MSEKIYSVSDINQRIKQLIDSDRLLLNVAISGELSNYKVYPSGHHYFTLKDESSVLRAVMFRNEASSLKFRPESGMKVVIRGRVAVYPRDGQYQLYANEIVPDGIGELAVAFEQLKQKLQAKGYFELSAKKTLPKYPTQICLITSPAGAAVRDMLRILKKRWPVCEILILPVRVQGEEAPGEIAAAIDYANTWSLGELIITGRGGGSIEDLWAFNEECVADAIYRSALPIVSAVGHEPDVTIADFVADLRAATPSNAAELTVPDAAELALRLKSLDAHLRSLTDRHVKLARSRLNALSTRNVLNSPAAFLREKRQRLLFAEAAFGAAAERLVTDERARLGRISASLDALSPLKVLSRGYSIVTTTDASSRAILSANEVKIGQALSIRLHDGSLTVTVSDKGESNPKKRQKPKVESDREIPEQLEI